MNSFSVYLNLVCFTFCEQIKCIIKYLFFSSYVLTALLGGATAGLGSSLGAVPGGQPSAPNLNPPSQIDPSSIERAYAALGLTYQGNQIQAQTSQPNMSNQGLQGQAGMRPLNPMGESCCVFTCFTLTHYFLGVWIFQYLSIWFDSIWILGVTIWFRTISDSNWFLIQYIGVLISESTLVCFARQNEELWHESRVKCV